MDREEIIREFLATIPGAKFRFPDEPKWLSGEFIEQREERFLAYRKEHLRKFLVKLGVDEDDTDALDQLLRDIYRVRGNKPVTNAHPTLPAVIDGKTENIDEEMAPLIGRLNDLGISTNGCCQLVLKSGNGVWSSSRLFQPKGRTTLPVPSPTSTFSTWMTPRRSWSRPPSWRRLGGIWAVTPTSWTNEDPTTHSAPQPSSSPRHRSRTSRPASTRRSMSWAANRIIVERIQWPGS